MEAIKLVKVGELPDGTQRFQSQLYIGRQTADFIIDVDNKMKYYGRGINGFDFYPYNEPYQIVSEIKFKNI
jgi:hypothetical protein